MISVHFQGKPYNIMVIQVYAPISNTEEAEVERFYEDLQDLSELTPEKDVLLIIGAAAAAKSLQSCLTLCDPIDGSPSGSPIPRGQEWKSRKSRNTWSNKQIWPWNAEGSRAKANRVLPRECTGHSKHPLPTTQEKTLHTDITRWSIPKSA